MEPITILTIAGTITFSAIITWMQGIMGGGGTTPTQG